MGRRRVGVMVAVAAVGVAAVVVGRPAGGPPRTDTPPADPIPVAPALWFPSEWDTLLGTDVAPDAATWEELDQITDLGADAAAVEDEAASQMVAKLTGVGSDRFAQVFEGDPFASEDPELTLAGTCSEVTPVAVSSKLLPFGGIDSGRWAKVAVAWSGSCEGPGAPAPGEVRVSFVYAHRGDGGWRPVRETQVPGSGWRWLTDRGPAITEVIAGCDNPTGERARPELAAAVSEMCADAVEAGLRIRVVSGWRSESDQLRLWETAVSEVGEEAARRWVVAPEDGRCVSRHCDGAAVDIAEDPDVLSWVAEVVGCRSDEGVSEPTPSGACPSGSVAVPRHLRYGLTRPFEHIPTHLEWGLPDETAPQAGCGERSDHSVAAVIAASWRCELARAGRPAEEIRLAAAGAVAQARCASGWNPAAVASGGRFLDTPDPRTGEPDTRAGVHLLSRDQATRFVPGGYGRVRLVGPSATGGARMWLAADPDARWAGFVCGEVASDPPAWAFGF